MITLAFYKGTGRFDDRVIRWITRSAFSHVELLEKPPACHGQGAWIGRSWSSSGRDGGVRSATIVFQSARWQFVPVPWAPERTLETLSAELGKPYDFIGLLGSQLFNLRRHRAGHWFCSELCAHALGLSAPQEVSPGGLYRRVCEMNRVYDLGHYRAGEPPEE
jgi:hypothetical protein